jgi:hypothetical protein
MSAEYERATADIAGLGLTTQQGSLTLQFKLAQANSPEVDSGDTRHITGLKPGDFFVAGIVDAVFDGEAGVEAIHCGEVFTHAEFYDQRGGLAERHLKRPLDIESRPATNGSKRPVLIRKSTSGVVVPTREVYLIIDQRIPCVMYCGNASKDIFAQRWNLWLLQQKRSDGKIAATCTRRYRLFSQSAKNQLGRFFVPQFEDLGPTPLDQLPDAIEFAKRVVAGSLRLAAQDQD